MLFPRWCFLDVMFFPPATLFLRPLTLLGLPWALVACGNSSPTSPPTAARQPALSLATTSRTAPPPPDAPAAGPAVAQEGDKPDGNHLAIDDTLTLAPGLFVQYQRGPGPAPASGQDPLDLPITFSIRWSGELLFHDTTDGYSYDVALVDSAIRKVYPLWIPTGPDSGELLVLFNNRPSKDRARRFFIRGRRVTKIDTLLTFDGPATDVDGDGRREFSGYQDHGEVWDDAQGRHRQSYNPTLYYEVRPTGLVLDSALTRRKVRARYGKFYGFTYSDKPVILAK